LLANCWQNLRASIARRSRIAGGPSSANGGSSARLPSPIVSTILILVGDGFAVMILIQLRRSFSIMSEAREVITSGVCRFVHHPLYLAEEIAAIGSVMQFLSAWTVMLLAVHIAFQFRRMWNEEAILSAVFPHYATYKKKLRKSFPEFTD